ncbi:MAG: ribbon-helix-helix protein, CopG family [Candidatus Bathyarchaeia archaeon]
MKEQKLVRNVKIKVYLTQRQKQILEKLCEVLGTSESEALRLALVNYAEKLQLLKDLRTRND